MLGQLPLTICLTVILASVMTSSEQLLQDVPTLSTTFGTPKYDETLETGTVVEDVTEGVKPQTPTPQPRNNQFCGGGGGCCGFPGMPGIPGTPGHNGMPGQQGAKGEPGMKGDGGNGGKEGLEGRRGNKGPKGESGPPGPPGEKGDTGNVTSSQGLKGEKGNTGATGMKGYRGPRGPQGIQGPATYQLPDDLRIAFTVTNATRFPSPNSPIVFQTIVSNSGDGYNSDTGKFTCRASGLYAFTYQLFGGYHNFRPQKASLMKNSEVAISAMSTVDSRLGNFAILNLVEDDEVWIEVTDSKDFGPSNHNSFSGFRLY